MFKIFWRTKFLKLETFYAKDLKGSSSTCKGACFKNFGSSFYSSNAFFTTSFRMTLLTLFVGTANISFFHLWLKLVSSTNDFIC